MIEAQELRISMDADAATAKEFFRFLYIGRLYSDAPSLELIVDLLRLADYYGVKDEFVKIVEGSSFDSVVVAAADAMDEPSVLLVRLSPFLKESRKTQQLLFAHLKLAFGRNVYKSICHAIAYGLDELLDLCRKAPVLNPFVLKKEINEDVVRELLCVHRPVHPRPAITSQAVQRFVSICTQRGIPCHMPGDEVEVPWHPEVFSEDFRRIFGGNPRVRVVDEPCRPGHIAVVTAIGRRASYPLRLVTSQSLPFQTLMSMVRAQEVGFMEPAAM